MIGYFIEYVSLVIIVLPLLIACIAMHIGAGVHSSLILRDLGVPLGLLMCFLGFVGILQNASDPSALGTATGIMLLTVLYGGILASVGYFWGFKFAEFVNFPLATNMIKWWAPSVSIMTFLVILGWVMDNAAGVGAFFYQIPLSVSAATAAVALLICNRKNMLQALSQSFLLSAMINVLIGIIYYYNEVIGQGVAIGLLGIVYGLTAYICLYFLSFKLGDPKKLDPSLMNWHWLEISGFVIFMFLAPVSLAEYGLNIEDDKQEEKLELRIQDLERKLDLLSQQPTQ